MLRAVIEYFEYLSNNSSKRTSLQFGKIAALVSERIRPQLVGVWSTDNSRSKSHCNTSPHSQSYLDDLPDDNEATSEWKFEGHIYLAAGRRPARKTHEDSLLTVVEEQYYQLFLFLSTAWKFFTTLRPSPTGKC